MPKPKLTDEQKSALRAELRNRLKRGQPQADIKRALAESFKVSPESIRWYLKQASAGRGAANGRKQSKGKVRGAGRRAKTGAKGIRRTGGRQPRLIAALQTLPESTLKRILAAKRLQPRLDAERERATALRAELRDTERRARRLERKVARLLAT